jgi:hypothetical protein
MVGCNFCGKPMDGKDGELQLFVSGENVGHYCSIDCWTKAIKKMKEMMLEANLPQNKCGKCAYIEKWECGGSFFFYCGRRKSNRTDNGLLKVKCKDAACSLFKRK